MKGTRIVDDLTPEQTDLLKLVRLLAGTQQLTGMLTGAGPAELETGRQSLIAASEAAEAAGVPAALIHEVIEEAAINAPARTESSDPQRVTSEDIVILRQLLSTDMVVLEREIGKTATHLVVAFARSTAERMPALVALARELDQFESAVVPDQEEAREVDQRALDALSSDDEAARVVLAEELQLLAVTLQRHADQARQILRKLPREFGGEQD